MRIHRSYDPRRDEQRMGIVFSSEQIRKLADGQILEHLYLSDGRVTRFRVAMERGEALEIFTTVPKEMHT
jgi:hypothetical protein